ncbi:hypothetical protein Psch_02077 [Pelotomaculum schinkii]|uniref:Uncharacterized protein n=1 Tax=Pelotomaculum schinkii TaxID=78350 RepID=A0A4Y7RI79_9FIRM|nr:hypothetical protein Psch_02077 [Pelotomaculum schinkii]TEB14022.1 hypothetical protein Psfp_03222 [Pelotomaculum sp. FP]
MMITPLSSQQLKGVLLNSHTVFLWGHVANEFTPTFFWVLEAYF